MPFWEKVPVPGTLSISTVWLQSFWMARSVSQETFYLSAKKRGKRSLQSKLEMDYLSAWGFWLKIFDWMSYAYLSFRGATLLWLLSYKRLKIRKKRKGTLRRERIWIKSLCKDTTSSSVHSSETAKRYYVVQARLLDLGGGAFRSWPIARQ